ncbi:MAG: hypothetical protein K2N74_02110 [Clostridiales bacterium]|nr:hypothetical protein [Clostridiales bacterium]
MKKLILKTALLTFAISLVFLLAIFGIMSFAAPTVMMKFTASLGMDGISGDYAYQAYKSSSGEDRLSYLVRAFETAAERGDNRVARDRFAELFGEEDSERRAEFEAYCAEQAKLQFPEGTSDKVIESYKNFSYRGYLCGQAACVYYRLAKNDEEKADALAFAFAQTGETLSVENSPLYYLALESAEENDGQFCLSIYDGMNERSYEQNKAYQKIETALKSCKNFEQLLAERNIDE